jgi:ketosteroid isomerase-like protein
MNVNVGHALACPVLLALSCLAQSNHTGEREIRKTERQWLNSYLTRDAAVMDRIEADEFRIVYPDGSILTKAQELENLKKATTPQAELKLETGDQTIRIYGETAVVTGNFIQKGRYKAGPKNGQDFRIVERYTDVYVKRDGRWQVVASQLTSAPQEQPAK